jgi:type I restriction enzyme, S subunit
LRFPGYKKAKFNKGVPDDWLTVKVEKLIHRISAGKRYDSKSALANGKVPIIDQGASGVLGYHNDEPGVFASENNPVIIFTNHTCYQRLIQFPFSSIQNVLPFIPSKIELFNRNIYWLYYATKGIVELSEYKGHYPEFINKQIYMPEKKLCEAFGKLIEPIFQNIYLIDIQNTQLRQIRDRLLPRLISGKLEVK